MLTGTGWNNLNRTVFYQKDNFIKIEVSQEATDFYDILKK